MNFDLSYERIIGRTTNLLSSEIKNMLALSEEKVLVTGAGGSIGSKIAKELSNFSNCELLLTDRDENRLHSLSLDLMGTALFNTSHFKVLDIRDRVGIQKSFDNFRPTMVIHAAALKHLSILENQPREAYLTNVIGTYNLIKTSLNFDNTKFLNISTDKAANPTSILGKTKWIGELITSYCRRNGNKNYTSVRFGNVFNSRGSVIETFIRQLMNNQPVTLTDMNVSRYFMKLEEAASLSIASVIMNVDEVHVLNMGEPVKLIDVIQRLKNELNSSSPINIVGLRKGEKLNEELIAEYEIVSENSTNNIMSIKSKKNFRYLPELNHKVSTEIEAINEITKLLSFACIN